MGIGRVIVKETRYTEEAEERIAVNGSNWGNGLHGIKDFSGKAHAKAQVSGGQ
jgi:hypothetical protein